MKALPFISRKKHNRLITEQWERCRETLIIRGRLWMKSEALAMKVAYDDGYQAGLRQGHTENGADKVTRMRDLTIPSDWDQMVEETQTDLTTTVRPD